MTTHERENDAELKDRVGRLMAFLRELVASRSTPILRIDRHQAHYWLADALEFAQISPLAGPGDVVLRAPRVTLEPAPDLPAELHGWISLTDRDNSTLQAPPLNETGPSSLDRSRKVTLEEEPHIRDTYHRWLLEWNHWAATDRERRPHHELYKQLSRMRQALTDQPESVEVVLASGYLEVPESASGGEAVATHLVTQPIAIEQDPETGDHLCRFGDEATVNLEDSQLLTGHPAFDPSGTTYLRDRLVTTVTGALDPELLGFLKEWANRALTLNVEVGDDSATLPLPRLRPAPALVLRKRGAFALLEYYDQMIKASQRDGEPVPLGIAQLVEAIEPDDRLAWLEHTGATAASDLATAPLFPLPANEEQRQIINRLGGDSGVVVEGPPGTGKTHTIANLMSTLLASGQRILVTSEKAQALRVLRDKLPPEMQELCVSITDIARGGSTELNRSVASLAARKAAFNPAAEDRTISDLTSRRDQIRRRRAETLEAIRALREHETYQHPAVADGYAGTAAHIARQVAQNRPDHGWMPLPIQGDAPLTPPELDRLLELTRTHTEDRVARGTQQFPPADARPDPSQVEALAARVHAGDTAETATDTRLHAIIGTGHVNLLTLAHALRDVGALTEQVRATDTPWSAQVADTVLSGRESYQWDRATSYAAHVTDAQTADEHVGLTRIEGLDQPTDDARRAFTALADYLDHGGAIKRLFKADEQKAAEPWLTTVTVDGQPVTTGAQARLVQAHLDVYARARDIADLLSPIGVDVPTTGPRPALVGKLLQLRSTLEHIQRLHRAVADLTSMLGAAASRLDLRSLQAVEHLTDEATRLITAHDAKLASVELDQLSDQLQKSTPAGHVAPEVGAMIAALRHVDADTYRAALHDLVAAETDKHAQQQHDRLLGSLKAASPALADLITHDPDAGTWARRVTTWHDAWEWGKAATWVEHQSDPSRDTILNDQLAQLDADLGHVTAQLAAARSWRAAMARMTAGQVQALQAYRDNLANVGMGTGKYAERYRQAARSAMEVAQGAVPAWVMPLQQVLASIPPQQNSFDVVIVDEASQADITSLFLLWLAPRVIVVGDDKQCTPSEVSAGALDKVFDRLDSYLSDVPIHLRATLTPRSSIFSMLRTRFGQVVRLREHFRCMPEIITWSSQMFYRDAPLVPLRQFGADRLPPLKTTYVEGGYTEGRNARLTNPVEAEAIVETIEACLADPTYDGKTFGVVVLQGQSQVDVIRNALLNRIPSEVREERRLRIGTPPDFQGDERHVVFLSMVVSPEQRFATLTKNEYQRRYNVAASRAQDQLWLFHSVTPDRLAAADLRHSLLTYMVAADQGNALPMPDGVHPDRRHQQFDSLFEQRVYLDLAHRGYHVTPQVEVNSRRIDLVVTGRGSKLAVECDGDAWHTSPEQVQADLDRELELRRCGWTFWRIRESEYYLNKDRALATLWETLDELGIGPYQADAANGDIETEHSWTPAQLPDDESPLEAEEEFLAPAEDDSATAAPPAVSITRFIDQEPTIERPDAPFVAAADPASADMIDRIQEAHQQATSAPSTTDFDQTTWPPSTSTPQPPPRPYRRMVTENNDVLRAHILRLAERGPISNGDVREATGLDGTHVRNLLMQLMAEGLLYRTGAKRGTRYHLMAGTVVTARDTAPTPPKPHHDRPLAAPAEAEDPTEPAAGLRAVSQWLTMLDDRELDILRRRCLNQPPTTLEEIGGDYGVSRERIRQIEVRVRDQGAALLDPYNGNEVIRAAVDRTIHELGVYTPVSTIRPDAERPLTASDITVPEHVLLWLAGYCVDGTMLVRGQFEAPRVGEVPLLGEGPEVDEDALHQLLRDRGVTESNLPCAIAAIDGIQDVDGKLVLWGRSAVDRAASILATHQTPMTPEEIIEALGGNMSLRSLRQRLYEDNRFTRTSRSHVGLIEWGLGEYTSIAELMRARLEHGAMPLTELATSLHDDFDIPMSSVILYSRAPMFTVHGDTIALRDPDDPFIPRHSPDTVPGLYQASEDVLIWHRHVDADILRGSGQSIPMEIANFLGVTPGQERNFSNPTRSVSVKWPTSSHVGPQLGSLMALAEARGAREGDTLRILFDRAHKEVEVELAPTTTADESPAQAVAHLTGLPDTLCRDRNSLAAAAFTAPGRVLDVLRNRGDTEVAARAARLPWEQRQ